ncbi:hypothetical protein GCM10023322_08530 [Rugosimonospora acidiphila]|uniref:NERD domain-containing protein n=1 Tax=Rugosimonospora acidiphila TaxID=556531 RepID=A0ABP9RL30_9ACTN
MRVEYLSDHGGQQLQQAEQQLHGAQAAFVEWHGAYAEAASALKATRRAKPLWKRLLSVRTPEERDALARSEQARQQASFAQSGVQQLSHRVEQRAAGVRGEDALAWGLSGLPDAWVMLRGYRNRRGEADHVLVGPQGVWVIEVKLRRVRLHVNGDEWRYEKLDRWGNPVESGWATDRSGRSWARQASDVAEDLAAWLHRNHHVLPVRSAVMLMHEDAQLGRCDDLAIDFVATQPGLLLQEMWRRATPLTAQACEDIVALIRRDHQFHNRRRRSS